MPDGGAERTYSPRADVTIVRDRGFGVPHIYGSTRSGAMFGLGYAGAEDRLFFMDVLRHAGPRRAVELRGRRPTRAWTPSSGRSRRTPRPTSSARCATCRSSSGRRARRSCATPSNYLAGVNQYIFEAKLDPTKLPGEYAAIGRPQGPDNFKPADIIATAALVGGIFGKGGGKELRVLAARGRAGRALRPQARRAGVRGLPRGRGPRGAGDGLQAALPVPGAAEEGRRGQRRAAGPRHAEAQPRSARPAPSSPASRRARRTRCWSPARSPRAGTR